MSRLISSQSYPHVKSLRRDSIGRNTTGYATRAPFLLRIDISLSCFFFLHKRALFLYVFLGWFRFRRYHDLFSMSARFHYINKPEKENSGVRVRFRDFLSRRGHKPVDKFGYGRIINVIGGQVNRSSFEFIDKARGLLGSVVARVDVGAMIIAI